MNDTQTRRRRNWVLIGAVLALMIVGTWSGRPARMPTPYFDLPRPMVIAHQGGNLLWPGNTLLAFDQANELGVDVLEMDVHLSADEQVVVIHDASVNRTTDGNGDVAQLSLEQLRELDAAYHWPFDGVNAPHRGKGVVIPTLEEVLLRYPQQRFLIELKADDSVLAAQVCKLLTDAQRGEMTLVASFHSTVLHNFRGLCPKVATSASSTEVDWFLTLRRFSLEFMFNARSVSLQVPLVRQEVSLANKGFVADAKAQRLFVDFWTANTVVAMNTAINSGAQGVITDRPDLLLDELGRLVEQGRR